LVPEIFFDIYANDCTAIFLIYNHSKLSDWK